jgi:hypothetical protein
MTIQINIDPLIESACKNIGLAPETIKNIANLERESLKRGVLNASNDFSLKAEERLAMRNTLNKILDDEILRINSLPATNNPTADIVSGGPGTGKSVISTQKKIDNHAIYLCGDEIKKTFKNLAKLNPILSKNDNFMNDAYLHRVTSDINWKLLDHCTKNRKNFVLEMLGTNANSDADMLNNLVALGYSASFTHICTSQQECAENIVRRYLGDSVDGGRYISILKAKEALFVSNESYANAIKKLHPKIKTNLYNNSNRKMSYVSSEREDIIKFIQNEDKPDLALSASSLLSGKVDLDILPCLN